MNSRHPYGRDIASLTANLASLYILYLFMHSSRRADGCPKLLLLWGIAALAAYLLLAVILPRSRTGAPIPVITLGYLALLTLGSLHLRIAPASPADWLGCLFLWGILLYRITVHLIRPASPESRLLDFELCTLLLIVTVLCHAGGLFPLPTVLVPAVGSLASLLGLIRQRTASGDSLPGGQMLTYTLLLPTALVILGGGLFLGCSGALSSLLQELVSLVQRAGLMLANLLYRFLTWLSSLFPQSQEVILPPEEETAQAASDISGEVLLNSNTVLVPLMILLLVIGTIILLSLARNLRIRTIGKSTGKDHRTRTNRHFSLRQFITDSIHRLIARIQYLSAYLRYGNSPMGVYCWLEIHMKTCGQPKKPSETPTTFLARCEEHFPDHTEELKRLREEINPWCYGRKGNTSTGEEWKAMRKRLKHSFSA